MEKEKNKVKKSHNGMVKFIPCDMWKRGIYVFIGSFSQKKTFVLEKIKDEWSDGFIEMIRTEPTSPAAEYDYDIDGTGIIHIKKYPQTPKEYASLAHEIMHAVFVIMDFVHVDYIPKHTNETYTYLCEHITRNVLEKDGYIDANNYGK